MQTLNIILTVHIHVNETDFHNWTEQVWGKTLEEALLGGTSS